MKILIISGVPWTHTLQRHQKIALQLSSIGEVTYLTGVKCRIPSIKEIYLTIKSKLKNIFSNKKITGHTTCITDKISLEKTFQFPDSNFFFRLSNKFFYKKSKYDIVITYLPHSIVENYINSDSFLIYDCVRDFHLWGGYPNYLKNFENSLVKRADDIWVDSFWLKNKISNYNPRSIFQIFPTYSDTLIKSISAHSCLSNKKLKSLCYYGSINAKLDLQLLIELSSNYKITLIGPVDSTIEIPSMINYLLPMEQEELFNKVLQYDGVIIPYKGNMDGVIPAKTSELLNLPMPVFISSFFDSEKLSESWYVYDSKATLLKLLDNFDFHRFFHTHNKNKVKFSKYKDDCLINVIYSRLEEVGVFDEK